jgi:hypothetical protein
MFGDLSDFKKNLYLNIGLIVGFVIIFGVFYFLLRANIDHQVSVINDIKSKRNFVSQSAQNLALLVKDAPIAQQYAKKISSLVPTHDYLISSFSSDISNFAKRNNVSLSFVFGNETPSSGSSLGFISFSATMDGSWESIVNFLNDLENRYYSIKINSMDVNKVSDNQIRVSTSGHISFIEK